MVKYPKHDIRQLALLVHAMPKYKPDFKVRASSDLQYVKIDRATYLAMRTRTIATKELPSSASHALTAETDEVILKDLEIARHPDVIAHSPTLRSDSHNPLETQVSTTALGPKAVGPRGSLAFGVANKELASIKAAVTESSAGASPSLAKMSNFFRKSRNSIVNVPLAAVAARFSPAAARRISVDDVSALKASSTPHPHNGTAQVTEPARRCDTPCSDADNRLSRQSLPSAVDCYVKMNQHQKSPNEPDFSENERSRLLSAATDMPDTFTLQHLPRNRTDSDGIAMDDSDDDSTARV